MQKITPFLWYDTQAEEAMLLYTSIFKDAKRGKVTRYGEGSHMPAGSVMSATFELSGQEYTAFNGGAYFTFTTAISFMVKCETQTELDEYWEKLTEGADETEQQCGWLKDKFGLSWQIVPVMLMELLDHEDPEVVKRVWEALMQMKKIDIQTLKAASQTDSGGRVT